MLTTLRIKNLALAADLTVEFGPGYNVITGETGAGKSLLIGALNLVLGERADRALIRSGADSCSVEAVFDVHDLKAPLAKFLSENGLEPCEDSLLVLKRAFTAAGSNRQFVNGSPATVAALSTIGEWLVDIHGPHEHQSLLRPARQLALLDAFGKLEEDRARFSDLVRARASLEAEKAALVVDERTYAQQLDLLRHQVNEISAARLDPDEEQQVTLDHQRASNAARLLQLAQGALDVLTESETSILTEAGILGRALHDLERIDPASAGLVKQHENAVSQLNELRDELSRYAGKVEIDPARLGELEERLNIIHSLKRKYGGTLSEVIAFGTEARQKLQTLEQRDAELGRLNAALQKLDADLMRVGQALTAKRRKIIPPLSRAVSKQLADLGFKQCVFEITLNSVQPDDLREDPSRLNSAGLDTVEFQFAPNPGEPIRPLRAIASSGELARAMLALKTVLAVEDEVPVLVFDEVDANIGGETANVVGDKMCQIGRNRQVLCITHLPQVAAPAAAHFVAAKRVTGDRTISEITRIDQADRVTELARMLGGQTDAARKHALALVERRDKLRG